MRRHVQKPGVRYWAGDDLIELQSEPLRVVEDFFSQFGNMIISGCEIESENSLTDGLVALSGKDPNGQDVYKVAPVKATTGLTFPIYLTLKCEEINREYGNGELKAIVENYTAEINAIPPSTGSYLTIYETDNKRFSDAMGVTHPKHKTFTLISGNWVNSGTEYTYTVTDTDITDGCYVAVCLENNSVEVASEAELLPKPAFETGKLTFFAKNQPTDVINLTYTILS